jgi:hypothetical protein
MVATLATGAGLVQFMGIQVEYPNILAKISYLNILYSTYNKDELSSKDIKC